MKRIFASLLVISIMLALSATAAFAAPPPPEVHIARFAGFIDCDDPAVIDAAELGIVVGTGDGYFKPLRAVTRAEWVQMLYKAFCPDKVEALNGGEWYEPARAWLSEAILSVTGEHDHTHTSTLCVEACGQLAGLYTYPEKTASYDWMVSTLILATYQRDGITIVETGDVAAPIAIREEVETLGYAVSTFLTKGFSTTAVRFATEKGFGQNLGNWRNAGQGETVTRLEAVRLLMGLYQQSFSAIPPGGLPTWSSGN